MPAEFKFQCPHCSQSISSTDDLSDSTQTCPTCAATFTVPNLSPPPDTAEEAHGLLDWIESILHRMVRGIFRFIFAVLPPKIWRFICDTFPWLAKLIRITVLFCVWSFLVSWPLIILRVIPERWPDFTTERQPFTFILAHQSSCTIAAYTWVGLALFGSLWGIFHITIRRRRQRKAQLTESLSQEARIA